MARIKTFFLYDEIEIDDSYDYWGNYEDDPVVIKAKRDAGFVCPHCGAVLCFSAPCKHAVLVYDTLNCEFTVLDRTLRKGLEALIAAGVAGVEELEDWDIRDLAEFLQKRAKDIAFFEDLVDSHPHSYASAIIGICGADCRRRLLAGLKPEKATKQKRRSSGRMRTRKA